MANIIFIGHDASLTGAPYTQLYLIQWLTANTEHTVDLVLLRGGALEKEFEKVANVRILPSSTNNQLSISQRLVRKTQQLIFVSDLKRRALWRELSKNRPSLIYANTAETLVFASETKAALNIPLLLHIHELKSTFFYINPISFARLIPNVDFFITCSQAVKQFYESAFSIPIINSQVVYDFSIIRSDWHSSAADIREELNIPPSARIIGGAGTLGWRKGTDLFLQIAYDILRHTSENVHFIWLGADNESNVYKEMIHDAQLMGISDRLHLVAPKKDLQGYYQAFDVFTLTSREDPFPLVCMEAALLGCPIICFEDGGGMPEFVKHDAGFVVPYADFKIMSEKIVYLINNESVRIEMSKVSQSRAEENNTIRTIGPEIYQIIEQFL